MCCRLQLDLRELLKRGNGLFGSAEMTGSIGVVTINMARLGYLNKGNKAQLYADLDHLLEISKTTLEKKRVFIQEMYDRGLFPYTKRYLPHFRNHFSTIGVNGINEMIQNFTDGKEDIVSDYGMEFATEILEHIRTKMRTVSRRNWQFIQLRSYSCRRHYLSLCKRRQKTLFLILFRQVKAKISTIRIVHNYQ
jgi:anaerobic ribonucleoside-triphosphate reductase